MHAKHVANELSLESHFPWEEVKGLPHLPDRQQGQQVIDEARRGGWPAFDALCAALRSAQQHPLAQKLEEAVKGIPRKSTVQAKPWQPSI